MPLKLKFRSAMDRVRSSLNTAQRVLLGYIAISLVGLLLLWIVEGHSSGVGMLDHLFTSVSAVSTTGLTSVTLAENYSFTGQVVILGLIQIGGLGYMTIAALLISRLDSRIRESQEEQTETDFALPPEADIRSFAKAACVLTACVEICGAAILYFAFASEGIERPLWNAIFHSVSAFCTSGLSLFPDSFEGFSSSAFVLVPISVISIIGAIGFLVAWDIGRSLRHRELTMAFTNRVVLIVFSAMLLCATVLLYFTDARLAELSGADRWLNAFFAAMTSSTTAGFNALPTATLSGAAFVLIAATMVIGASPSGTSGGIKTTTASILVATMISSLRQEKSTRLFGREVSAEKIRASSTTLVFYVSLMVVSTFLLAAIETGHDLRSVYFEVISALGTIGLSYGASEHFGWFGKSMIIVLMIAGRVGILAFGAALFSEGNDERQLENAERV